MVYSISSGPVIHITDRTPISQCVLRSTAWGGPHTQEVASRSTKGACLVGGPLSLFHSLLPPDAHPGGGSVLAGPVSFLHRVSLAL